MLAFCPQCGTDRELREEARRETYKVRGEEITVDAVVPVCPVCGEDVSIADRDDGILDRVYREYRRRKGLLQPEEIVELRERYGLSQRGLSRLMGWGQITVQRYEKGNLQDNAHDALLRGLEDPGFVLDMLARSGDRLSKREKEEIREAALGRAEPDSGEAIREYARSLEPRQGLLNGWRDFSIDRLGQIAVWFANSVAGLNKVKLAKLLWLADFSHYYRQSRSITGLAYARLPLGPVPHRYQTLLGLLEDMGYIRLEPVKFSGGEGESVKPLVRFDPSSLTESELETLARVRDRYGSLDGTRLSKLSHGEAIWTGHRDGDLIAYAEADGSELIKTLS